MAEASSFSVLFRIALLALGISKARAASLLQVDKSLVGRWAAGTIKPTEHNISRITELVAKHVPGFSMQDWQREAGDLAKLVGVDPALVHRTVTPPFRDRRRNVELCGGSAN